MIEITSIEQAEQIIKASSDQPVLLFKHSTRCGVSAFAVGQFIGFQQEHPDLPITYARVLVVEQRPVSEWFAERLDVSHASPQIMLIVDGGVVWHTSHFAITEKNIAEMVFSVAGKES